VRNVYRILIGKPEGKIPSQGWEDIEINLKDTVCEGVNWVHLTQDRHHWQALGNTIMVFRVIQKAGNFLIS
jgi:hypothetical protein